MWLHVSHAALLCDTVPLLEFWDGLSSSALGLVPFLFACSARFLPSFRIPDASLQQSQFIHTRLLPIDHGAVARSHKELGSHSYAVGVVDGRN